MRALSGVVVAALLVAVAIAAVVMFFTGMLPMLKASANLMVTANKLSVNYITSGATPYQVATFDVRVENKADKQLTISALRIQVLYSDGSTGLAVVNYDPTNGWQPGTVPTGLEVTVQGGGVLNPGQAQDLMVTLKQDISTGPQIRQVAFQIVAKDPAGNEYTATANTVDVT